MDLLKKIFPISFKATEKEAFIKALIIYIVADVICGIIGTLSQIPVIGIVLSLLSFIVGIYATAGVVLSILVFVKVIK